MTFIFSMPYSSAYANRAVLWEAIIADASRVQGYSGSKALRSARRNPGFRCLKAWRLAQFAHNKPLLFPLFRFRMWRLTRLRERFGIHLPLDARIGPGCLIFHHGCVVLNSKTVAGKNLTLSHEVTIGHTKGGKHPGCPTLGDNVFLAPGAKVIGGVTIGDDVAVGPNSVVTEGLAPFSVVAGNPAKLLSLKGAREYVPNRV